MNSRQAKDFLVGQAVQQAAIEGVSLSELEKRMMYFTEGPDAVEDPIQLNEEFEAAYDMAGYEAKVSGLLRHARRRIKAEGPEQLDLWNQAIATLNEGDHYLTVMAGGQTWPALGRLSIRLLAPIAAIVVAVFFVRSRFGRLPHIAPSAYYGTIVLLLFVNFLWPRRNGQSLAQRLLLTVVRYLFGK